MREDESLKWSRELEQFKADYRRQVPFVDKDRVSTADIETGADFLMKYRK